MRHLQVQEGWGDPKFKGMPKLELVLRGGEEDTRNEEQDRAPTTYYPRFFVEAKRCVAEGAQGRRWYHAMGSCRPMFLWLPAFSRDHCPDSEFDVSTHLTFRDVAVDKLQAPSMLKVHIKASKTDPFRVGVHVVVGKVEGPLCPVSAVLDYLLTRGGGEGPLFRFLDGKPLTRSRLVDCVRQALQ